MKQRMQEQPESSLLTSTCSPSFNSYSNANLADIAARVVQEQLYDDGKDNDFYFESEDEYSQNVDEQERRTNNKNDDDDDDEEEKEFEFAFVTATMVTEQTSPISADEIFQNGQIRPVYPLFNTDLLRDDGEHDHQKKEENDGDSDKTTIRVPLRNLFIAERETSMTRAGINTSSSSSSSCSDNDELEGVPEGTYCVWRPNEQEGRCKKSSSTGSTSSNNSSSSSKRWRFKDLIMPRSHSDGGKDSFVLFNPTIKKGGYNDEKVVVKETTTPLVGAAGKVKSAAGGGSMEKRRSYLPYRQDLLVGVFR